MVILLMIVWYYLCCVYCKFGMYDKSQIVGVLGVMGGVIDDEVVEVGGVLC